MYNPLPAFTVNVAPNKLLLWGSVVCPHLCQGGLVILVPTPLLSFLPFLSPQLTKKQLTRINPQTKFPSAVEGANKTWDYYPQVSPPTIISWPSLHRLWGNPVHFEVKFICPGKFPISTFNANGFFFQWPKLTKPQTICFCLWMLYYCSLVPE